MTFSRNGARVLFLHNQRKDRTALKDCSSEQHGTGMGDSVESRALGPKDLTVRV